LSPEKRISKRQMKQDKLVGSAFQAAEYVQNNKKYFIIGLVSIVMIGLIIYFIDYSIAQKGYAAEELYGKAQIASAMQQPTLAISDYKTIIEQYGSTKTADRACYNLGKVYYDQDNCDSAMYYFNMYINNYGKVKLLLGGAYGGVANCLEKISDFAGAGEYYFNAAELINDDLQSPEFYMAAGRTFNKAGLYENAVMSYQLVIDKYPRTLYYSNAKKKLAEIKYKVD